jgi:hypothetical protein
MGLKRLVREAQYASCAAPAAPALTASRAAMGPVSGADMVCETKAEVGWSLL